MSEERVKPRSLFVDEAIALALESRWAEALAVNQALVERHGPDEDTLNRILWHAVKGYDTPYPERFAGEPRQKRD